MRVPSPTSIGIASQRSPWLATALSPGAGTTVAFQAATSACGAGPSRMARSRLEFRQGILDPTPLNVGFALVDGLQAVGFEEVGPRLNPRRKLSFMGGRRGASRLEL